MRSSCGRSESAALTAAARLAQDAAQFDKPREDEAYGLSNEPAYVLSGSHNPRAAFPRERE